MLVNSGVIVDNKTGERLDICFNANRRICRKGGGTLLGRGNTAIRVDGKIEQTESTFGGV
jgi:hypothetical protein